MRAGTEAAGVPVRAVWFDVGETLIDESREYGTWADWLGVPRHTFSAMFGAVIARGGDYREVFQHFRPGFDLGKERQARLDAGDRGVPERPRPLPRCPPVPAGAQRTPGTSSASRATRPPGRAGSSAN